MDENHIPQTTLTDLPDEVLILILKLVADFPVRSNSLKKSPPFPLIASCVSRRWRTIALSSPEIWTTIRISHHSRSWQWARLFVERSGSQLLDISINLESWVYQDGKPRYAANIPMSKALEIVGAHIRRWRRLAIRGWSQQLEDFCQSTVRAGPGALSQLQSAHLSLMGTSESQGGWYSYHHYPPSLSFSALLNTFSDVVSLRSLRLNAWQCSENTIPFTFRTLHTLDIDYKTTPIDDPRFRQLFGPASTLSTLVVRGFRPSNYLNIATIDTSTIRSFAVSFRVPIYSEENDYCHATKGFESITDLFSLPNLECLEIIGGFTGDPSENRVIRVPDEWEPPLFPYLRTLRLEEVGFSHAGLAFLQSLSRDITALELIYTTGNQQLLALHPGTDPAWPALRSLTVETHGGYTEPDWLAPFVAMRASISPHMRIQELAVLAWLAEVSFSVEPAPAIYRLHSGPSSALMDGLPGHNFYTDPLDGRPMDFGVLRVPARWFCNCGCNRKDCPSYDHWPDHVPGIYRWYGPTILDLELFEEDITENFKAEGRSKGRLRERRRAKRGDSKGRRSRRGRVATRQWPECTEDFYVA